ncbi:13515_t:CDS:2 [Ambispora gerdemannii]|uniref:13515_t:CDS:1 n=1 Tax=Ambispora gerdemannii TaxID=144530 RepID=A0A9N8YR27_9GLOM|nr:13515_t:CDS:2 [Ambispora gerdemannii]
MSNKSGVILRIGILAARDLAAADRDGFSDPYVVVRVGNQKYQTQVISKNLNPVWNRVFDAKLGPEKIPQHIVVTVWDDDRIGRDFLGEVTIPLKQVFVRNNGGLKDGLPRSYDDPLNQPAAYPLQKRTSKSEVKGDIVLKFGLEDNDGGPQRNVEEWSQFWEQFTLQIELR